jgi:hypothetical protein
MLQTLQELTFWNHVWDSQFIVSEFQGHSENFAMETVVFSETSRNYKRPNQSSKQVVSQTLLYRKSGVC